MMEQKNPEIRNRELNPNTVRYRLANAGWSTFKIIVNYAEEDARKWKIIIGVGLENIDCVYKINHPNMETGRLEEVFILTDNQNYLPERIIPASIEELITVLEEKFPHHVFFNPIKKKENERNEGQA